MTNFFIASENGVRDSFSLVSAENTCSFLFWSVRSFRRLSARLSSRAIASERPWKYRSYILNSDQSFCLTPKQMTKLRIDLATLTSPRRSKLQWAAWIILRTSASSHTSNTYTHCGSFKLPQFLRDVLPSWFLPVFLEQRCVVGPEPLQMKAPLPIPLMTPLAVVQQEKPGRRPLEDLSATSTPWKESTLT